MTPQMQQMMQMQQQQQHQLQQQQQQQQAQQQHPRQPPPKYNEMMPHQRNPNYMMNQMGHNMGPGPPMRFAGPNGPQMGNGPRGMGPRGQGFQSIPPSGPMMRQQAAPPNMMGNGPGDMQRMRFPPAQMMGPGVPNGSQKVPVSHPSP